MTILNLMKIAASCLKGQKTLWEKEKLLIMSNFFFSCSVFKRVVLQTRENQGLFGKRLRTTRRYVLKLHGLCSQKLMLRVEKGFKNGFMQVLLFYNLLLFLISEIVALPSNRVISPITENDSYTRFSLFDCSASARNSATAVRLLRR